MRTAEDVRTNPVAGDVLRKRDSTVKVVSFSKGSCVLKMEGNPRDLPLWEWHEDNYAKWREWAKFAEVIHIAQGGPHE